MWFQFSSRGWFVFLRRLHFLSLGDDRNSSNCRKIAPNLELWFHCLPFLDLYPSLSLSLCVYVCFSSLSLVRTSWIRSRDFSDSSLFPNLLPSGKDLGRKDIAPGILDKKLVSRASNARAVYKIVHHARECKSWLWILLGDQTWTMPAVVYVIPWAEELGREELSTVHSWIFFMLCGELGRARSGKYNLQEGRELNTEEKTRYLAFYSTRGTSDLGVRLRKLDFVFLWKQVCSSRKRVLDAVEEPSDFQLWIRETEGEKTKKQSCWEGGGARHTQGGNMAMKEFTELQRTPSLNHVSAQSPRVGGCVGTFFHMFDWNPSKKRCATKRLPAGISTS